MNNIRQLREAAGMKQSELADRMNVRPPTVFKWENGIANPTIANLIQLAEIFGVSLDEVVGRKPAPRKEVLLMKKQQLTSFDDLPLIMTVEELAPILGVGKGTVYELVRCGRIKSLRIGTQIRILKQELIQFLESSTPQVS